jgi:hypothetical protein
MKQLLVTNVNPYWPQDLLNMFIVLLSVFLFMTEECSRNCGW